MDNMPNYEKSSNDAYQGYSAQPYGADEMPQSTYPQQGPMSYAPREQEYSQQPPIYTPPSVEQGYGQQQQPPIYTPPSAEQGYGQQQQQYYGQQQTGQNSFGAYQSGSGQGTVGDVGPLERTGMGLKARTAGMFCYLFGWVGGLVFLVLERENRFVRFHAMQSILFFGILSLAQWLAASLPYLDFLRSALGIVTFVGWLFLFITANKGRYYKLPALGDLAERILARFH